MRVTAPTRTGRSPTAYDRIATTRTGRTGPVAWLLAPAPAARLALLRILVGGYATVWAAVRLPAHLGHADQLADRWQPIGVLALLGAPLADAAIAALAVGAPLLGAAFAAGWRYRVTGRLCAAAMLTLCTVDGSWGQVFHTENLMVLHVLILALAPAADVLSVDARRGHRTGGSRRATAGDRPDGRYGWPVRLAAVVVVLAYVLAGIAKLRLGGLAWLDGDTLRHLVAHDNLRKALLGDAHSPIGTRLVAHAWVFPPLAALTLAVELGAGVALAGGRWRTAWVASAWLFHVGVLALMAVLFPYQLSGVAFAAFFPLERIVDRGPARR